MKIDRVLIGNRLELYRQYLNMTQPFVSDYTGILQSTLSGLENGKAGGLDVLCTLLMFYQKHFDLVNFFADDFTPVPRGSVLENQYQKRADKKQRALDKKLQLLKLHLNEVIEVNKKS